MARVLVAGCGYVGSALAERLARAGHEVVGIRRNPAPARSYTSVAMDLAAPAELTSWFRGENGFDAVVCNAMLEHDKHFWKTIEEIHRVSRPGAIIAIGVPGYLHLPGDYGNRGTFVVEAGFLAVAQLLVYIGAI